MSATPLSDNPRSIQETTERLPDPRPELIKPAGTLKWTTDSTIQFKNTSVRLAIEGDLHLLQSKPEEFVLGKSREMVERLLGWVDELHPQRIVDIGVFKGGSAVLLNEYCRPEKLVAIERNPVPCEPLEQYLKSCGFEDSVSIHYGVDQSDLSALKDFYEEDFGTKSLDLVIDDASHFLFETRESLRFFFPHLRPGGLYIIEDWGWAHWPEDYWQKEKGGTYFKGKAPVSNLILELMILSASAPDVVESLWIDRNQVLIKRGPREMESPFLPETLILNRGMQIPVIPGTGENARERP